MCVSVERENTKVLYVLWIFVFPVFKTYGEGLPAILFRFDMMQIHHTILNKNVRLDVSHAKIEILSTPRHYFC